MFADSISIDFESGTYATGSINGQDGWSATGSYDQEVVSTPTISGGQSFRISNGVASGSFGDQTFSKSLVNEAGEADSTSGGMSTGPRQNHFEAQFDFKSTQSEVQPGLFISVSPDRGDGSRMSYLGFADTAGGINVYFYDVQDENAGFQVANFVSTVVATGLSRDVTHTARFVIDYVDGPSNDVVKIYIDGILEHTGTTWENYYRFDTEASAEQHPRTTDNLLFRSGGTAVPANAGKGFLFDNISLSSSIVTPLVRDAHITSPTTGQDVYGEVNFVANLTDDDADPIQWAVRQGTCAAGTSTVFGNVDGHTDVATIVQSDLSNQTFSFIGDMSAMTPGLYCFIYNPVEDSGETGIRETVQFDLVETPVVVNYPTDMVQCKDGGWKTFTDPSFKNQGSCVSYVQSNVNAGKR